MACVGLPTLRGQEGCPGGAKCCPAGLARSWLCKHYPLLCCAMSRAGVEGNGYQCCSVTLMLTALLFRQLYHSNPGCASTCTASQKDPEAPGSSTCDLQGRASRLEDTGQWWHPL